MTCNNSLTRWRYNDDNENYDKCVFDKVYAKEVKSRASEKSGEANKSVCIIRIPVIQADIEIGDYVRLGIWEDDIPHRGKDYRVAEVSDNRQGVNRHWRIKCEQ